MWSRKHTSLVFSRRSSREKVDFDKVKEIIWRMRRRAQWTRVLPLYIRIDIYSAVWKMNRLDTQYTTQLKNSRCSIEVNVLKCWIRSGSTRSPCPPVEQTWKHVLKNERNNRCSNLFALFLLSFFDRFIFSIPQSPSLFLVSPYSPHTLSPVASSNILRHRQTTAIAVLNQCFDIYKIVALLSSRIRTYNYISACISKEGSNVTAWLSNTK